MNPFFNFNIVATASKINAHGILDKSTFFYTDQTSLHSYQFIYFNNISDCISIMIVFACNYNLPSASQPTFF